VPSCRCSCIASGHAAGFNTRVRDATCPSICTVRNCDDGAPNCGCAPSAAASLKSGDGRRRAGPAVIALSPALPRRREHGNKGEDMRARRCADQRDETEEEGVDLVRPGEATFLGGEVLRVLPVFGRASGVIPFCSSNCFSQAWMYLGSSGQSRSSKRRFCALNSTRVFGITPPQKPARRKGASGGEPGQRQREA